VILTYTAATLPIVSISAPTNGATYALGHVVESSFTCADGGGGTGIASCLDQNGHPSGAAIDTSTTGSHTFTVTATSNDGLTASASVTYNVATPGYYEAAADGGVFAFNAPFQGSMGGKALANPLVSMTVDSATGGYYEVASDGGVFAFDAPYYGSVPALGIRISNVVGMAVTSDGKGYWLVGSDGGVFSFGDASFYGSVPGILAAGTHLDGRVVGIAMDPATGGYWLVGSDGGIFSFNAPYQGSMGGKALTKPAVGMAFDPATGGYYEVASDGGVFAFDSPFQGSMGGKSLNASVVGMALGP
jgi:hypothetical protein